jgi:hypothetical protein
MYQLSCCCFFLCVCLCQNPVLEKNNTHTSWLQALISKDGDLSLLIMVEMDPQPRIRVPVITTKPFTFFFFNLLHRFWLGHYGMLSDLTTVETMVLHTALYEMHMWQGGSCFPWVSFLNGGFLGDSFCLPCLGRLAILQQIAGAPVPCEACVSMGILP